MAGKIIADTIESAGSQISLNVGNVTVLTASSTGLTLIPTTNVNVNLTNSIVTLTNGSATSPGLTFSGNTRTGLFMPSANTLAFTAANTESMRIDSSGNVGIGTNSPSTYGKLAIYSASGGSSAVTVNGGTTISDYAQQIVYANAQQYYVQNLVYGNGLCNTAANPAAGQYYSIGTVSSTPLLFTTTNTERMRIDSSGNFLVGNTTQVSGERFSVGSGSNVLAAWIQQNTNTSGYNVMVLGLGSNGNNTSSSFIRGNTNAVGNWYLYGNGTTSFTSDQRLKKNIESTRNGYLEDLAQLRVVKYNWLKDNDGTPKELGLIAQEVEQVFPGLVQDDTSRVSEDDETVYKTLKQSVLPFMLLKAIQELKVIVDAQSVEIAALKAK